MPKPPRSRSPQAVRLLGLARRPLAYRGRFPDLAGLPYRRLGPVRDRLPLGLLTSTIGFPLESRPRPPKSGVLARGWAHPQFGSRSRPATRPEPNPASTAWFPSAIRPSLRAGSRPERGPAASPHAFGTSHVFRSPETFTPRAPKADPRLSAEGFTSLRRKLPVTPTRSPRPPAKDPRHRREEPQLMDRPPEPVPKCLRITGLPAVGPCSTQRASGRAAVLRRTQCSRRIGFCRELGKARKPYRQVDAEELARVAGTVLHGGAVAVTGFVRSPPSTRRKRSAGRRRASRCSFWTGSATRITWAPSCGLPPSSASTASSFPTIRRRRDRPRPATVSPRAAWSMYVSIRRPAFPRCSSS